MKEGIHPNYGFVVFRDEAADFQFITRSTARSKKKITIDGEEYPLVTLDISSASHPFYTGRQMLVDTAGRIEKFNRRYGKFQEKKAVPTEAAVVPAEATPALAPDAAPDAAQGGETAEGGLKLS